MIFPVALKGEDFLIERPADHGGNATFPTFEVNIHLVNLNQILDFIKFFC